MYEYVLWAAFAPAERPSIRFGPARQPITRKCMFYMRFLALRRIPPRAWPPAPGFVVFPVCVDRLFFFLSLINRWGFFRVCTFWGLHERERFDRTGSGCGASDSRVLAAPPAGFFGASVNNLRLVRGCAGIITREIVQKGGGYLLMAFGAR